MAELETVVSGNKRACFNNDFGRGQYAASHALAHPVDKYGFPGGFWSSNAQPDAFGRSDDPRAFLRQPVGISERMHVMRRVQPLQFGRGQVVGDLVHGIPHPVTPNPGGLGQGYDQ